MSWYIWYVEGFGLEPSDYAAKVAEKCGHTVTILSPREDERGHAERLRDALEELAEQRVDEHELVNVVEASVYWDRRGPMDAEITIIQSTGDYWGSVTVDDLDEYGDLETALLARTGREPADDSGGASA